MNANGIDISKTLRNRPQMNGSCERSGLTLFNKVRCMLKGKGLRNLFWTEATLHGTYLKNISPTTAIKEDITEKKKMLIE